MNSNGLVLNIQILRGIAAMLVVLRHCFKEVGGTNAFAVGQVGVDIFFVISGFVIYHTARDMNWHLFLRKRIARIVPLYWTVTAIALVGLIVQNEPVTAQTLMHVARSLLFLPSTGPDGVMFPTLYVGWTLNFEMWFYAVFALVLFLRGPVLVFTGLVIVAAVLAGLLVFAMNDWRAGAATIPLLPISLEFLAGMWLAHFYAQGRLLGIDLHAPHRFAVQTGIAGLLIGVALIWLALAPVATPYTVARPLIWGIPAVMIVAAALLLEGHRLTGRIAAGFLLIGNASYALYLIHPVAIRATDIALAELTPSVPGALMFVAFAGVSILSGIALHLYWESPATRIVSRQLGLGRPTVSV